MRMKPLLLCIMAVTLLALSACAGAPSQASVELSCDEFTSNNHIKKEVEIAAGGVVTVDLCENRTTGFQWSETAEITDTAVIEQTSYKFTAAAGDLAGAAGEGKWTLKALKKGTTKVSMEYSQDWAGGLKSEWTFELTVVVK